MSERLLAAVAGCGIDHISGAQVATTACCSAGIDQTAESEESLEAALKRADDALLERRTRVATKSRSAEIAGLCRLLGRWVPKKTVTGHVSATFEGHSPQRRDGNQPRWRGALYRQPRERRASAGDLDSCATECAPTRCSINVRRHRIRTLGASGCELIPFLIAVFDEWVRHDVGSVLVPEFEITEPGFGYLREGYESVRSTHESTDQESIGHARPTRNPGSCGDEANRQGGRPIGWRKGGKHGPLPALARGGNAGSTRPLPVAQQDKQRVYRRYCTTMVPDMLAASVNAQ